MSGQKRQLILFRHFCNQLWSRNIFSCGQIVVKRHFLSLSPSEKQKQKVPKSQSYQGFRNFFIGALQGIFSAATPPSPRASHSLPTSAKTVPRTVFFRFALLAPSLFESLYQYIIKTDTAKTVSVLMARCKGFEPLTFWFVVGQNDGRSM